MKLDVLNGRSQKTNSLKKPKKISLKKPKKIFSALQKCTTKVCSALQKSTETEEVNRKKKRGGSIRPDVLNGHSLLSQKPKPLMKPKNSAKKQKKNFTQKNKKR